MKTSSSHGLWIAVAVYGLIFLIKVAAYLASGVMVLLAEALHTLTDIFVATFLLVADRWSRKESDTVHMFGYGRAQNVAALVAATLFISFTSFKLAEEAIPRLFQPAPAISQGVWALAAVGISMALSAAPLVTLLRDRSRGPAAKALVMELLNDEIGLIAALGGTAGAMAGWPLADPLAALGVAALIAFNALGLFRENASMLLGRAPDAALMEQLRRAASTVEGVAGVVDIRAEYVAPDVLHVGVSVLAPSGSTIDQADKIVETVKQRVHELTRGRYCLVQVNADKRAAPDNAVRVPAA